MWKISVTVLFGVLAPLFNAASGYSSDDVNGTLNDRPIIGILAQEYFGNSNGTGPFPSYIAASYVKFVEMGGARAVPIMVNQPEEYYRTIFKYINGVLFPGGEADIINSSYSRAGKLLYDMAVDANAAGDTFPIWGTCLGFELLTALLANRNVLIGCKANDLALPLNFTKDAANSYMFGNMPSDVRNYLEKSGTTVNYHVNCFTPQNFTKFNFGAEYSLLSTNVDSNGLEFISAMEAIKYPFFGVQFHPEKNTFEWVSRKGHKNIPHTWESVRVAQHFSSFFVQLARRSQHKFPSQAIESTYLIYNYQPTFTGEFGSDFIQSYFFPF